MAAVISRRFDWAGWVLGIALGGFFDGILLHQILQWHHLLSAVNGQDIRFQVAFDGYFHALMYLVAALGLWLLWRGHRDTGAGSARLAANMLLGFGIWHLLDAVLSHWVTGIHRIRMDSDSPLLWDIAWLVVFGLLPLAAGWRMRRSAKPQVSRGVVAPLLAAAMMVGAGASALLPPGGSTFTTALFHPGTSAAEAFAAVVAVGGRVAWTDASGQVVVFDHSEVRNPFALYGRGAILVSGSGLPSGCFGWART